ncbi:acylsugar acyltransferase 3-like [Solanum pennellii]|uniref:Acylsugar acyltransferase 3-like n=1 Tax=Solanum pennellii TaxID=28526 RepID=A0ABM1G1Y3_SOLPN|nr:acylsugar acyltransferase 3-like [Solanum pennellii]
MDDKSFYVDCNDIGVEYLNVRVSCPMSEILNHATDSVYSQDLPWRTPSSFNDRRPLVVQLSHFDYGGIAHQPCVSKMYSFSSSSLGRLKDTVSMNLGVQNPTRFEVATALIHECGRAASKANNSGIFIPSLSCHLMNLHPSLPLNTIGNGVHFFNTRAATEDEIQVPHFVAQLCKAKQHHRYQVASRSLMEIILEPAGMKALGSSVQGMEDFLEGALHSLSRPTSTNPDKSG